MQHALIPRRTKPCSVRIDSARIVPDGGGQVTLSDRVVSGAVACLGPFQDQDLDLSDGLSVAQGREVTWVQASRLIFGAAHPTRNGSETLL